MRLYCRWVERSRRDATFGEFGHECCRHRAISWSARDGRGVAKEGVAPGSVLSRDTLLPNGRPLLRAETTLSGRVPERLREFVSACGLPDDLRAEG
jgi:hypothetical protein